MCVLCPFILLGIFFLPVIVLYIFHFSDIFGWDTSICFLLRLNIDVYSAKVKFRLQQHLLKLYHGMLSVYCFCLVSCYLFRPFTKFHWYYSLSISLITLENGTWNKNLRFQDQKEIKRIYHMDYVVESYLLSVHFNFWQVKNIFSFPP